MKYFWLVAVILIIALGAGIFFGIAPNVVCNRAYALEENVFSASSDINIQEKRRSDLIYNLADCVSEYSEHESEVFREIAASRDVDASSKIVAIAEAYPELKSDGTYKAFMLELSTTENLIAQYRTAYNKCAQRYNRYVKKWPNKNMLEMKGYEAIPFEYLIFNDASSNAPQNLFD